MSFMCLINHSSRKKIIPKGKKTQTQIQYFDATSLKISSQEKSNAKNKKIKNQTEEKRVWRTTKIYTP